jgi:hypothetical protein
MVGKDLFEVEKRADVSFVVCQLGSISLSAVILSKFPIPYSKLCCWTSNTLEGWKDPILLLHAKRKTRSRPTATAVDPLDVDRSSLATAHCTPQLSDLEAGDRCV